MRNPCDLNELIIHPVDAEDIPSNIAMMPRIYRLVSLSFNENDEGQIEYMATVFHEHAAMRVTWVANRLSQNLKQGNLVSPRWFGRTSFENGAIRISRLVAMECPEHWVNLFHTVPHEWVKDRALIKNAAMLVKNLPCSSRFLFNCNYWDGQRFMELCHSQNLAPLIDSTYF